MPYNELLIQCCGEMNPTWTHTFNKPEWFAECRSCGVILVVLHDGLAKTPKRELPAGWSVINGTGEGDNDRPNAG